jgi:WD40 repeat protein
VVSTDQQNEGVVVSDDGRLAATWNEEAPTSPVQVADGSTGRVVFTLPATTVADVTFSPDDRFLVVADSSGGLHVAELANHRVVVGNGWPQSCPGGGGDPPAVSDHDALVAVYTFCGQVTVGHLDDARPFETFNQHQQLSRIAFDPAGDKLALASWDSSVTVVDVTTDRPVLELIGHSRGVTGVVFTSTGGYIITSSGDDTLRVWDATTGQLMQVDRDDSALDDVSSSPDGRWVAEENSHNEVRVWAVCPDCRQPSALLTASVASVVSPLTPLEREAAAQAG